MGRLTLAEYMQHSNRGGGGRKSYLKQWKNEAPFAITVWLSTQASIYTLWRHNFQKVEPRENKDTKEKTREVWMNKLVCWESEEVLSKQYWRDKFSGEREYPPQVCPHCLLIEDVRRRCMRGAEIRAEREKVTTADVAKREKEIRKAQLAEDALDWLMPLFRFEGTDPTKTVTIHAGGMYNAFGSKDLTEGDKKRMAAVPRTEGGPIYSKDSFKQSQWAKMEYVYVVANHDDVAAGLQIAIEPNLLGDKMKSEIAKQMKRNGQEKGNPILHPYAFRWEHNSDKTISFDKKYDATAMDQLGMSPAIEKLVRGTDPPDVGPLLERFNARTHRAMLERHALVQLPWDEYFRAAFALEARGEKGQEEERRAPEVGREIEVPDDDAAEEEEVECDGCHEAMPASATKCPHCGAEYEVEVAAPPEPPPPPRMKRSEVKRQSAPAPGPAKKVEPARGSLGAIAPKPHELDDGNPGGYPGDPSDDVPFAMNCTAETTERWNRSL
jgi:hypothetical protein